MRPFDPIEEWKTSQWPRCTQVLPNLESAQDSLGESASTFNYEKTSLLSCPQTIIILSTSYNGSFSSYRRYSVRCAHVRLVCNHAPSPRENFPHGIHTFWYSVFSSLNVNLLSLLQLIFSRQSLSRLNESRCFRMTTTTWNLDLLQSR